MDKDKREEEASERSDVELLSPEEAGEIAKRSMPVLPKQEEDLASRVPPELNKLIPFPIGPDGNPVPFPPGQAEGSDRQAPEVPAEEPPQCVIQFSESALALLLGLKPNMAILDIRIAGVKAEDHNQRLLEVKLSGIGRTPMVGKIPLLPGLPVHREECGHPSLCWACAGPLIDNDGMTMRLCNWPGIPGKMGAGPASLGGANAVAQQQVQLIEQLAATVRALQLKVEELSK